MAANTATFRFLYHRLQSENTNSRSSVVSARLMTRPIHAHHHHRIDSIKLTFKSVKPQQVYTLSIQPTDTIATVKAQLAAEPGAPPADVQRLLLKGKALADGKLLKEYDVKDEDTINLMVKPGYQWDPTIIVPKTTSSPAPVTTDNVNPPSITLVPEQNSRARSGHGRIPSVVLSPSPSLTALADEKLVDIPLTLDTSNMPAPPPDTPYRKIMTQSDFWERLYTFLSYVVLSSCPLNVPLIPLQE